MKFSTFLRDNMNAIVADWEAFARTLPAAQTMSTLALRDHSREILLAIAEGMDARESAPERAARSRA
ncbi:MAG TPA: two-component sensor histidine kinase, partial [Burkholderiaceae bacterium]